jgi:hypothetical protein
MKCLLSLAVLFVAVFSSCKKDVVTNSSQPLDDSIYNALRDCTIDSHYDSLRLAKNLHGTWKQVWYENGGKRHLPDSTLTVYFDSSGKYLVLVNVRPMSAGHWSAERADGEYFKLKMTDTLNTFGGIPGRVLTCGDGVYFDDESNQFGRSYYVRQ